MPVVRGTQIRQRNQKISCKLYKTNALYFAWNYNARNIHQMDTFRNWIPINQRFKQCVTSTIFTFVQNKCLVYMNEVFRPAKNITINTRYSCLKLNYPYRKTSNGQKGLSHIGPAFWNSISEILKKTKNLNTFKHKMKHYYLNDFSNPNLWNIGWFDYALAIIKNIFLFIKQIFLHLFFLFCSTLIEGPQWK